MLILEKKKNEMSNQFNSREFISSIFFFLFHSLIGIFWFAKEKWCGTNIFREPGTNLVVVVHSFSSKFFSQFLLASYQCNKGKKDSTSSKLLQQKKNWYIFFSLCKKCIIRRIFLEIEIWRREKLFGRRKIQIIIIIIISCARMVSSSFSSSKKKKPRSVFDRSIDGSTLFRKIVFFWGKNRFFLEKNIRIFSGTNNVHVFS